MHADRDRTCAVHTRAIHAGSPGGRAAGGAGPAEPDASIRRAPLAWPGCTRRTLLAGAAAGLPLPLAAQQPAWPQQRPIRLVIPFAPGSDTDLTARTLAAEMSPRLGQAVVPENRPGASGAVATASVARTDSDGYTLLFSGLGSTVLNPEFLTGRQAIDLQRDLVHLAMVGAVPCVLVVNPRQTIATLDEYLDAARRRPGRLEMATLRLSSPSQTLGWRLAQEAGVPFGFVPYRNSAEAAADVIADIVPSMIDSLSAVRANLRVGSVRALCCFAVERSPAIPQVPTARELGYATLVSCGRSSIGAPAGTPGPVQERLAAVVRNALETPRMQGLFAETATQPIRLFLTEAQAFVREEAVIWAQAARASGAILD
jgi:tripartite-type tricarboxylate transporter receptor subunit TctC